MARRGDEARLTWNDCVAWAAGVVGVASGQAVIVHVPGPVMVAMEPEP